MTKHSKTLMGSLLAIIVGSSCCWLSTALVGIGGAGLFGYGIKQLENVNSIFLWTGIVLALLSKYFYRKHKRSL